MSNPSSERILVVPFFPMEIWKSEWWPYVMAVVMATLLWKSEWWPYVMAVSSHNSCGSRIVTQSNPEQARVLERGAAAMKFALVLRLDPE